MQPQCVVEQPTRAGVITEVVALAIAYAMATAAIYPEGDRFAYAFLVATLTITLPVALYNASRRVIISTDGCELCVIVSSSLFTRKRRFALQQLEQIGVAYYKRHYRLVAMRDGKPVVLIDSLAERENARRAEDALLRWRGEAIAEPSAAAPRTRDLAE